MDFPNPPPTPADDELEMPEFTYAAPGDGFFKRLVIRTVETLTGQPRLKRLYLENRRSPRAGESFFAAAMRHLELDLRYDAALLEALPQSGPLVVVANHPYGVLDGLVLSYLIGLVRPDFKILTNSVLYRAPEIRPNLLPIDFSGTREAMVTNVESRAAAKRLLLDGGCVAVFPAGAVSTAPGPFGRAEDEAWGPFTGRLVLESRAPVVPVFFEGQNSWLFQLASQISMTLRIALIFHEVSRRIGTPVKLQIGEVIPFERLDHLKDRKALAAHLRACTYKLAK